MSAPARILCVAGIVLAFASCGGKKDEQPKKRLTRQQRDSVLAETPLPGAKVVGRAISVADSADARSKRLDEQTE